MRKTVVGIVTGVLLAVTATAHAQNGKSTTNQGSTPNGKPFEQIRQDVSGLQAQIDDLNAQTAALRSQVAALDARVTSIGTNLQTQLDAIYAAVSVLEGRVTANEQLIEQLTSRIQSVEEGVALLSGRVAANESAIVALNQANAALAQELGSVQAQLASATGYLLSELNRVASDLQLQINTNRNNIQSLQGQTASMQSFLNNLANYDCQAGQAVQGISPNGVIVCTTAGGGNLSSYLMSGWFYVYSGNSNYANPSCQAGYTMMNGGYDHWPYQDYQQVWISDYVTIPYTNNYWYSSYSWVWTGDAGWQQVGWGYYYPYVSYYTQDWGRNQYTPFRSSHITRDLVQYNTYYVAAQSQYGLYNQSSYVNWTATCVRIQ